MKKTEDEVYEERLAICLADDIPMERAVEIAQKEVDLMEARKWLK